MSKNTIHSSKSMQLKFSSTFINVASWLKKKINALQFSKKKSQRCKNEKNSLATHEIIAMRTFVIIKKKIWRWCNVFRVVFLLAFQKFNASRTNLFHLYNVRVLSLKITIYVISIFIIFLRRCVCSNFSTACDLMIDDWILRILRIKNSSLNKTKCYFKLTLKY